MATASNLPGGLTKERQAKYDAATINTFKLNLCVFTVIFFVVWPTVLLPLYVSQDERVQEKLIAGNVIFVVLSLRRLITFVISCFLCDDSIYSRPHPPRSYLTRYIDLCLV
jgi:hypothetical protein